MNIQLSPSLEQDLRHLAAQANTTADDVAQRALEEFITYRRDLNEAVQRANADIAAGRVYEHEEVVARIETLLGK
jgi:predicted transcriptional regulator